MSVTVVYHFQNFKLLQKRSSPKMFANRDIYEQKIIKILIEHSYGNNNKIMTYINI